MMAHTYIPQIIRGNTLYHKNFHILPITHPIVVAFQAKHVALIDETTKKGHQK